MNGIPSTDLGSWLSRGWNTFKNQPKPLILASVIINLIEMPMFFLMAEKLAAVPKWGWVVLAFNMLLLSPVLLIGWCALLLKAVRGSRATVVDLFSGFSRFGPAWGTGILVLLMTYGGMLLCIAPGIILWCTYLCSLFAVTDRQLSAAKALRLSAKITKGHRGKLFGVFLIATVPSLIASPLFKAWQSHKEQWGLTPLAIAVVLELITVLIIMPWTCAANASAYDSLISQPEAQAVPEAAPTGK